MDSFNLSYWARMQKGPKHFKIVFQDDFILDIPVVTYETIRQVLHLELKHEHGTAIGATCLIPANKLWDVNFLTWFGTTGSSLLQPTPEQAITKIKEMYAKGQVYAERMADPEFALIHYLEAHDWTYQYSDDHRSYLAGEASLKKIYALIIQLPNARAKELWEKHAPAGYEFPDRKL